MTAISRDSTPSRSQAARTAIREGLPTTMGRFPVAFTSAAVTIAPRLKIIPFAPSSRDRSWP